MFRNSFNSLNILKRNKKARTRLKCFKMNPFNDDADDFVFVAKSKGSSASPWSDEKTSSNNTSTGTGRYGEFDRFGTSEFDNSDTGGFGVEDGDYMGSQNIQNQIQQRQDNMLQSTQRSMRLMYEAEDVGNETAHELLRQGEQLQKTEQKLDNINADLTTSQRHINSMKSVFGGFRNYFSKKPVDANIPKDTGQVPSKLESTMTKPGRDEEAEHPAFRLRDPNPPAHDRYGGSGADSYGGAGSDSGAGYDAGFGQSRPQTQSRQLFEQRLDKNLDDLSLGLGRLKDLGLGLNDELDKQDDDIERITMKAEKADVRIINTNNQVKRILRK